jgi:glycosyltransferase involved in cell wall biosynthesis
MSNSLPLVSIGIPTYNRSENYLKQAVQSAVNQAYPNIEIIISDNCSTDNTGMVIQGLNEPRIRYFRQSINIGKLNNSNFCVQQAKGDYFLLLHDDDLIDHDFVSVCMKAVDYNVNCGVILTGTRVIDGNGKKIGESTNKVEGLSTTDFILGWFDNKVPLYLCSTLYNTRRLKEIGGFRSKKNLYDDDVALFQLAGKYGRKDVPDVKASFRRHSDNCGTATSVNDWCEDSLYLLDIICNMADNDKKLLRSRGMVYFSRQNYIRASRIRPLTKRFYTFMSVYKKFEYSYSPIQYLLTRNIVYYKLRNFKRQITDAV